MNPNKLINTSIVSIIIIAVASALYPTLKNYVDNATSGCRPGTLGNVCNGTAGWGTYVSLDPGIMGIITALFWVLIGAGVVLYWYHSIKTN